MKNLRVKNIYAFSLLGLLFSITLIFISNLVTAERKFWTEFYQTADVVDFSVMKRTPPDKPITLMFVGDIMLDRGVEYMIKTAGKENWCWPFLKITDDLKQADVLFGNLESVISDKGKKVGSIYSFRADPKAIEGLIYARFDVLSIANNHIFDYGREAMEDSFLRLKQAGIDCVGGGFSEKEARSPVIKEVKSTNPSTSSGQAKIAFLAYTNLGSKHWQAKENQSGIVWLDEKITEDIKAAREKSDIVVVSMHFGEEYQLEPNLEQRYFARLAIDSGADLVIGHHPHVVQRIEKYKEGYIVYSLGNFVFDQGFSEETMRGLLLEVLIEDAKIKEVVPKEIRINRFFQPEIK